MRGIAILGVAVVLLVPFGAHAAPGVMYYSLLERSDTEALYKQATFTNETWWRCTFDTLACTPADETVSLTTPGATPTPSIRARFGHLLPSGASWLTLSPDERYLAYYIAGTGTRGKRTFGVVDTTTGKSYTKDEKVAYWDLLTEGLRIFSFSPDSKQLIYLSDSSGTITPHRVNLASLPASSSNLPASKMFSRIYTVADITWKDPNTILFTANRDAPHAWTLYEYTLASGSLKKLASDVSYAAPMYKTATGLVFLSSNGVGFEPRFYNTTTGTVTRFALPAPTATPPPGIEIKPAAGLRGTYLDPDNPSKTLLVWLHGGPYRQTSLGYHSYLSYGGYDWILETAREAGIGVLKLDYPGSYAYTRAFAESLTGKVGVKDVVDTHAAIQAFATRNGYTQVYLMGNSYGGYLGPRLLVEKPTSYRGVLAINGVADWMTLLTRLDTSIFNVHFGGTISDENNPEYQAASIYNRLDRLGQQKVVLVHGTADNTIPFSESRGLATTLLNQGKNVEFIPLTGEDHIFKQPGSFEILCEATLRLVGVSASTRCDLTP